MRLYACIFFSLFTSYLLAQGPIPRLEARINEAYETFNVSGQDVLTVMMDRGIDYTHPDFIDENGKTRIKYIFDLYDNTGANDADNPYGLGTIYDEDEINASLEAGGTPLTNDIFGHGTATTGIMCGNGSAVADNEAFRGVAYNSKIICIVVTRDFVPAFGDNPGQAGQFNPALIPTGFQFASDKIEELGMPSVTLLNIGSTGDLTDGSTEICAAVDDFVAKGHPFVCGVGDDGGANNHAQLNLTEGQTSEIEFRKDKAGFLRLTLWYSEQDRFNLSIVRPNGNVEGPFDPPANANDAKDTQITQISIFHRGSNVEFVNSSSDQRQLLIDFSGAIGTYKIRLEATQVDSDGEVNAYLNPSRYNFQNRFISNVADGGSINSYSSCLSTISPTNYVATNDWVDIDGIARSKTGEGEVEELWIGSSVGSTMDGRLGVDVAAPGEVSFGAYSPDNYYTSFSFNVAENSNNFYGLQTAVSAAAPITTGVIALMLEIDPTLSPEEIKAILQETARSDSFTGTTPNSVWGYGKLDAFEAVNRVFNLVDIDEVEPAIKNIQIVPNPFTDLIKIVSVNKDIDIDRITIFNSLGQNVLSLDNVDSDILSLNQLEPGMYVIQIHTKEGTISRKVIKQ
ncbi:MAG: S8 family peptidase [Bacteroidota bacterium]